MVGGMGSMISWRGLLPHALAANRAAAAAPLQDRTSHTVITFAVFTCP